MGCRSEVRRLMDLSQIANECHVTAAEKGWWAQPANFGEKLMLVVSELAEALEEWRNGHEPNEIYYPTTTSGYIDPDSDQYVDWDDNTRPLFKPEGVPIELADAIIRMFDMCGFYKIDIEAAILEKMRYNDKRSYRHGGKRA